MQATESPRSKHSQGWLWGYGLLAGILCIMAVVVKGFHLFDSERNEAFIQGADDTFYYLWLRSVVVDRDLDFRNDLELTPFLEEDAKRTALADERTAQGLVQNKFPVGWAVLNAPLFILTHAVVSLFGGASDGFSAPYQVAIWFQQMLIALFGGWVAVRLLCRWVELPVALLAFLMTWLTSPMIYYQTARVGMVHNSVWVLAVVVLFLAFRVADLWKSEAPGVWKLRALVFGASVLSGLLVISRPSAITYLPLPVVLILNAWWRSRKRSGVELAVLSAFALLGALIGVFPQLLAWKILHGQWVFYSYRGEGFHWWEAQWYTSLFSPHHGLFHWHPMLAIGLGALVWFSVRGAFPRAWLLTLFGITWMNSAWHMVHFGSSFGGRAYEFLVFFAMAGLALLLQQWIKRPAWTRALMVVYLVFGIWNGIFLYLFMQGKVSREEPVTWRERIEATGGIFEPKPDRKTLP
jgi:hypothetical protein